jgi:predicted RecB family nuclease
MAKRRLHVGAEEAEPLEFVQLWRGPDYATIIHDVDCETAVYDFALPPHRPGGRQPQKSKPSRTFVPVLLIPRDKLDVSDSLVVCFGALAPWQATGILADTGTLIYGEGCRRKTLKIENHVARARQIIEAIGATCRGREPPPLVLNRHCAVCDFQPRCRGLAVERDDLSLLSAMTGKERAKCNAKGIFTIAQLSYGYRPRRRKRGKPNAERPAVSTKRATPAPRNDHKLKALAIKKNQIHVVGAPSLKFERVTTFLDVEGMPDRDFYYLVGLRFESGGETVERSFWADGLDGERAIWEDCLRTLKAIGNAQIVSYGAYEARFLRKMKERYISAPDDVEFVDRLIETSVNLLGCIYGKFYFPTFSNSLKEIGQYLGFEWTWPRASGAAAPLLRRAWELGRDEGLRGELIAYNMDDCRRAATRKCRDSRRSLRVNTTIVLSRPCECPTCNSKRISMNGRHHRLLFDIRFSEGGLRRWITKYIVDHYKCLGCGVSFSSDALPVKRHRYGDNVLAYVVYNIIELTISQYKLAKVMRQLFGYSLLQQEISRMMRRAVETYLDAYEEINQKILKGKLIHADETHVSVRGKDSYVWVFASMEEVIYIWSETREGQVATKFLETFKGVLVSDFYSVYDSLNCPQQKCLIHLMRDLNDDIHREPFNVEIKEIVREFGEILERIIDTIDRFGLKTHFLRKHKIAVTRFYDALLLRKYDTELAQKVQRRFIKNQDKLFTFLDYDNVPWNNNNAEHAVKSFADLRDVIGGRTTQSGIQYYLILLSIYQTCAYREIDFLGFLRGEKKIDGYGGSA